ncbi:MAG: tRNA pseudouridine(38-40) synthase TruA [Prevotellaceae bacterium]|nr:tRNA pseudouridine(38-40) synthase TruA [Prevotellaceae bacterium]
MPRYFIQLSYNGAAYHGWQVQENANSVQAELNKALFTYLREPIETIGAGRTDTGVHAKFYLAHFDSMNKELDSNIPHLLYKLNCLLPEDISVFGLKKMHSDAHARFDATARTYKYYICKTKNPFFNEFAYSLYIPLDINAMNKAAQLLFGYTDFTSFSKLHTDVKTNNCKITFAEWTEEADNTLVFTITADRFLRNMVRAIVGSLLDVGKGKISIEEFRKIIEQKDRGKTGMSAPAKGLFLTNISYPYDIG